MGYYNPHIIGWYNPLYTLTNQCFFHCSLVENDLNREAFLDLPAAALFRVDAASHEKMISKQILYSSLHICSMIIWSALICLVRI